MARKTPLRKPNCGEGIVSIKPRPKRTYDCVGLLYSFVVLLHDNCVLHRQTRTGGVLGAVPSAAV